MGTLVDIIIFAFLGAVLGFIIPFIAAQIYALYIKATEGEEADLTGAGAFSFFPLATIPLGAIIGFLIGVFGIFHIFGG